MVTQGHLGGGWSLFSTAGNLSKGPQNQSKCQEIIRTGPTLPHFSTLIAGPKHQSNLTKVRRNLQRTFPTLRKNQ